MSSSVDVENPYVRTSTHPEEGKRSLVFFFLKKKSSEVDKGETRSVIFAGEVRGRGAGRIDFSTLSA